MRKVIIAFLFVVFTFVSIVVSSPVLASSQPVPPAEIQEVVSALRNGDLGEAKRLIAEGKDGVNFLMSFAMEHGDMDTLGFAVDRGANLRPILQNQHKWDQVIAYLIKRGDLQDRLIHAAVESNSINELLHNLVKHGASKKYIMKAAIVQGFRWFIGMNGAWQVGPAGRYATSLIKKSVEDGVSPNTKSFGGYNALFSAAYDQDVEFIGYLVTAGANVNQRDDKGWTPLMDAGGFGYIPTARKLLSLGADPKLRNNNGQTAADIASEQGHEILAAILRSAERGRN